jgi:hypothetical protein
VSRARRLWSLVVVLGLVLVALLWLWRIVVAPPGVAEVRVGERAAARPAERLPPTPPPGALLAPTSPAPGELSAEPGELRVHDSVDLCTAVREPVVPVAAEVVEVEGITVAAVPGEPELTPTGAAFLPIATAHLIAGLLEEAAALTGTSRRERLTVIVHASLAELRRQAAAPAWSGGLYDGRAIHVPLDPTGDLGIKLITLRHEVMHAQLHAAIGCMPAWLDEGLAMYFDAAAPSRAWVRMVRAPDDYDLGAVFGRGFIALSGDRAERAYAESLAMVAFMVAHGGEAAVRAALVTLRELPPASRRAGPGLWDRLYPGASHRVVLDALAVRMFGVGLGAELEAKLTGVVCCYGFRAMRNFACRTVPAVPDKQSWIDRTAAPAAYCQTTW